MNVKMYVLNIVINILKTYVNMAFRHRQFKSLRLLPVPVEIPKQVTNYDKDGTLHVSYASVSVESAISSMPSPSETTLLSQMQSGSLQPVSLDDYQVGDLDPTTASSIINSLNVEENENT